MGEPARTENKSQLDYESRVETAQYRARANAANDMPILTDESGDAIAA